MKTSTVSITIMSLVLLLISGGAAQSEIELEPFPGDIKHPALPGATPQLPIFGETEGGVCRPPASWLGGGSAEKPKPPEEEKPKPPEKPFDPCSSLKTRLPYLPEIMDHLDWTNGAALMRDWFSRPANDKPKQDANPNIDTIKMDWVLGYDRAKKVYDKAVAEKVWVNAAAQTLIKNQLIIGKNKLPANVGDKVAFGSVGAEITSAAQMKQFNEDYYFQQRSFNSDLLFDPLDDLFAALADFNFNFVTEGTVERLPDVNEKARYRVTLDKIGIYVQDSYDFNDNPVSLKPTTWISQPLGYWDCADKDASKKPGPGAYYVTNQDFREWREQHGNSKGGDFLVFSDIKVIHVNDSFEF
jgi:hypothetical protein